MESKDQCRYSGALDGLNQCGWMDSPRADFGTGSKSKGEAITKRRKKQKKIKAYFRTPELQVPAEFIVQHNKNANPPTLLLTLHSMVSDSQAMMSPWFKEYLQRMWPRLEAWYNWFNDTQQGEVPGTFR